MSEPVRLQKFFSDCGILSRRAAEAEIAAGNVQVNGRTAAVGDKIDPETDIVKYKGNRILPHRNIPKRTVMLNKPRGYVSSAKDEKGRKTVTDLVRDAGVRLYPIGRLDMDSEGLLLLTEDGELANRLTHPRHEIPKIYHVTLSAPPTQDQLALLSAPMELDGYKLLPIGVRTIEPDTLEITLYEGRNRQIRRMCNAVGLTVKRLRRIAIGGLKLDVPPAKWRELTADEIAYLYANSTPRNERK